MTAETLGLVALSWSWQCVGSNQYFLVNFPFLALLKQRSVGPGTQERDVRVNEEESTQITAHPYTYTHTPTSFLTLTTVRGLEQHNCIFFITCTLCAPRIKFIFFVTRERVIFIMTLLLSFCLFYPG